METLVKMWGDDLALCIPRSLAAEIGLEPDTSVEISLIDKRLLVTPKPEPAWTLETLLAQITDENIHAEVHTGPAVGNEIW